MLSHTALKRDIAERIERTQTMMAERGLGALILVAVGAPDGLGALRYLTNVHLWSGAAYGVLGGDDPYPWLLVESPYQRVWSRNEATTDPDRVVAPNDLVGRTVELARSYAEQGRRIGAVNMDKLLGVGEHARFRAALEGYELVEVTDAYNAIRQIKTPFELEAIREHGAIVDASLDVFREHAAVGARYWDVCAATEGYVKSRGAFWGRTKLSLDLTPYTVPTARDRTMGRDDVINFEIVYESAYGYWLEMTTLFTFGALPDEAHALLQGYLAAVDASSAAARSGNRFADVSAANDDALRALGFAVVGKHTPDCHSTGLDGSDGPSSLSNPDFELVSGMVLSFHPGTVLAEDRGLLVSDNFLVTPEGAVRLSPHDADRYHLRLDG